MNYWVALDWGTSNFRAYLMDNNNVIDQVFTQEGMKFVDQKEFENTLVLQDFSKDEGDIIITWEYLLYNRINDEYDDSKFFTNSEKAFTYFIDKTFDMINN